MSDAELISASSLVSSARSLVGVRWLHRGRRETGVDCIGLVTLSMSKAGMDPVARLGVADPRDYSREPSEELVKQVEVYCERIERAIPGALLLFKFPSDLYPRHFGIYTDEGTVIHANVNLGRVVEHGYRMHWIEWTHSIWKLPGVAY